MNIRLFIVSVMKDQRNDTAAKVVKPVLLFLSLLYGIGIKIVELGYSTGIRKIFKSSLPVISVGNITAGGTGKTPFSMYLADYFVSKEVKPVILTRGYGGDENLMMKDELPGVSVIAGQDRFKSAERAADFGLDIAILDDGFQHRRLDREMDILLIDTVSFPGNRYLLPAGVLREPVEALKRADLFVLTKIDAAGEKRKIEVQTMLKKYAPGVPVICARHKPVFLTDVTGAAYSIDDMHRRKILVISAIADPDYLRFLIEKNGGMIFGQSRYPDHYHYAQNDIQIISDMARQRDADMVITTKKDYVKLRELDISSIEAKLFVLNITIEIEEGKEKLIAGLDRFINP